MAGADTLNRVAEIVRRVFKHPKQVVTADTTAEDVQGWDSLTHSLVLMTIERDFAIRFDPAQVVEVENVGDLVRAIDARLAAAGRA